MTRPVRTLLTLLFSPALVLALVLALVAPGEAAPAQEASSPTAETSQTDQTGQTDQTTAARAVNPPTPGNFTGYGFDQCLTPTQAAMDAWLQSSPFLAVGIYISGNSRACRKQPNLTPTWVSVQLARGWRLLPITLGPQASCSPRFPRYNDDPTIIPRPGTDGLYQEARQQGRQEAESAVAAATALGIVPGSTLWYDIEAFDITNTNCRESALAFLSAWTTRLHGLDYVSGVYSSAGSGIKILDDARVNRPGAFDLPDRIWLARWDGVANTSSSYVREDGWQPHARVKQYRGGHNETWGGVTINIDSNYLDVGRGSVAGPESHCGGIAIDLATYPVVRPATATSVPDPAVVQALQCLLTERGSYTGRINGKYNAATIAAARSWQQSHGFTVSSTWSRRHWMSLVTAGACPVVKFGSAGRAVRRVQRALNAASMTAKVPISGVFDDATRSALRAWQSLVGVPVSGVVGTQSWEALRAGRR